MKTNLITRQGYEALQKELDHLWREKRPDVTKKVAWAASLGDRSENADYHYNKKLLREIDRRLGFLARRMKAARVVDPAQQPDKSRIWFGATVELADDDDARRVVTLVGDDEAEAGEGRIGWNSPLARALRGAATGDLRTVQLPAGPKEWEVIAVSYP